MIESSHEFNSMWDSEHETPTLASNASSEPNPTFSEGKITCGERSRTIHYEFHIKMPKPRYYPMILARDEKGRILGSKFPPIET